MTVPTKTKLNKPTPRAFFLKMKIDETMINKPAIKKYQEPPKLMSFTPPIK